MREENKSYLIFGKGDIEVYCDTISNNKTGVLSLSKVDKEHEIGDYSIREDRVPYGYADIMLFFTKIESIDVVIERLQHLKSMLDQPLSEPKVEEKSCESCGQTKDERCRGQRLKWRSIMDKGLYCSCGCGTWIVGTSGIRCSRCYLFLPKEIRWTNVCENWTPKADKVEEEKTNE